jgi:hypothetical protein
MTNFEALSPPSYGASEGRKTTNAEARMDDEIQNAAKYPQCLLCDERKT